MSTVRWGILSTADIGMRKVTPAIQQAANCDVVAIASRDSQKAADAAGKLGIPTSYGTYEELLSSDDIDAVYIPLPNDMHAEWTFKAAAAGKHILCEKPLAMNAQETERMLRAAEDSKCVHMVAFTYSFCPAARYLKHIIALIQRDLWSFFGDPYV